MELNRFATGALSILTLAMAASCSVDEDFRDLETATATTDSNTKEIGFKVHTSQLTRAAGSYSNSFRPTQFKITAFEGADNYYGGKADLVTSDDNGDTWSSECRRYWPGDRPDDWHGLTFYAYIDGNSGEWSRSGRRASEKFDISGAVPVISNYEVDGKIGMQRDLMYAVARDVSRKSHNGKVSLNFRHALSQICFTAQNCNPTLDDIEILSIELGGVKGKGSYRFPEASTEGGMIMIPCDDLASGWDIDRESADCAYTLSDINMHLGPAGETGRGEVKNISIPTCSDGGLDCASAMFLLPQTVEARMDRNAAEGGYLKVKIRKTCSGRGQSEAIEEVYIPTSIDWQEGRRYIYNLTWKASLITFSVSVSDYSDVGC